MSVDIRSIRARLTPKYTRVNGNAESRGSAWASKKLNTDRTASEPTDMKHISKVGVNAFFQPAIQINRIPVAVPTKSGRAQEKEERYLS